MCPKPFQISWFGRSQLFNTSPDASLDDFVGFEYSWHGPRSVLHLASISAYMYTKSRAHIRLDMSFEGLFLRNRKKWWGVWTPQIILAPIVIDKSTLSNWPWKKGFIINDDHFTSYWKGLVGRISIVSKNNGTHLRHGYSLCETSTWVFRVPVTMLAFGKSI